MFATGLLASITKEGYVRLDLKRTQTTVVEVKTEDGSFLLSVRRPTKADLLEDRKAVIQQDPVARFAIWESLIVGWDGLLDIHGDPIPFTSQTRDCALAIPEVFDAVSAAIHALFSWKATEKNSETSAAPSSEAA